MDHPLTLPPLDIPALMRQYGLHADKRLGQNFLIDEEALKKVVEAADLTADDQVLEIGAGLGNLTRYLAAACREVCAVELDERLLPVLVQVVENFSNVRVVAGDILRMEPGDLFTAATPDERGYHVVANLPYYITSAVIRHLLEAKTPPRSLVLTVQREVAERICAKPGDMSLLALSVQVYGSPQIASRIPAGAFYPAPKVDSAVVRVVLYSQPVIRGDRLESFFRLTKAGFSQKRKTLRNSLSAGLGWPASKVELLLEETGINHFRRAETLSLEEWDKLTIAMTRANEGQAGNIHIQE